MLFRSRPTLLPPDVAFKFAPYFSLLGTREKTHHRTLAQLRRQVLQTVLASEWSSIRSQRLGSPSSDFALQKSSSFAPHGRLWGNVKAEGA